MTPFKLLLLPAVALRHVLKAMPLTDLFLLILFFEKFRKFARTTNKAPQEIRIVFNQSDAAYWIYFGTRTNHPVLRFSGVSELRRPRMSRVGGQNMIFRLKIFPPAPKVTCLFSDIDSLWTEIEKTIIGLFGLLPPLDVTLSPSQVPKYPMTCEKIRKLLITCLDNNCYFLEGVVWNKFMATHTVTQRVKINCGGFGKIATSSDFLKIDTVLSSPSGWFTLQHVINFTGRHLILTHTNVLETSDLISFIEFWFNGNMPKLESFTIFQGRFDADLVRNTFRSVLKEYDGKRRAAKYRSRGLNDNCRGLDCETALDMERPSDGLLVSIKITPMNFHFFVWHNRWGAHETRAEP